MQRTSVLLVFFLLFSQILPLIAQESEDDAASKAIPKVSGVSIIGNKEISLEKILEVINTKPGDTLNRERIKRDIQAVFDMGHFTDVKIEFIDEEGGTRVVFQVIENPVVRQIELIGTNIVPSDGLKNLMRTQVGSVLNTKLLYGDVIAINDHYEELGYTEPQNHVTEMNWTQEGNLRMVITEGVKITEITITGHTVYSTDKLRALVKTPVGELFNKKKIEEDIGHIATLYSDDDYLIQGLKATVTASGVVTISVLEAQVESIVIQGNKKTKEKVIRHQIRTKVGEILRHSKLKKDHQRLQNTGYFEKVDVSPEEGSSPGKVKLVFTVKDQKTGFATAGIGFSGGGASRGGGLTGTVSYTERNLGGMGRSVSVGWQKGSQVSVLNFSFVYPFLDDGDTTIGISYFNSSLDKQRQALPNTDPVKFALFKDRRIGGRVTLGRSITDDFRLFLTLKTEKLRATPSPTPEFPEIIPDPTNGTLNSVSLISIYDTRDDVFNAHTGAYYAATTEKAGELLGGDFDFLKYTGEIRQYIPHMRKNTIALRLMAGGSGGALPLAEKFVLGGTDTLRAYTLNRFIGDKFLLFSTEYRFPLLGSKMFSGAVFFDIGKAWQKGETMQLKDMKNDYGIGARISVPGLGIGTIRVDFAIGDEGKRTVIGIGQSF